MLGKWAMSITTRTAVLQSVAMALRLLSTAGCRQCAFAATLRGAWGPVSRRCGRKNTRLPRSLTGAFTTNALIRGVAW